MIDNKEIKEEFTKYNNFEKHSDIAKYLLLNPAHFNYIHDLIGTMEFDDAESISTSIKLVIKLLDNYNVNIFETHTGMVFKLVHTEKDNTVKGGLPEIVMAIGRDEVALKDDNIYLFTEDNINEMIYAALQGYNYTEVDKDISETEIRNVIWKQNNRGIISYSQNKDLIIGKGTSAYDIPVQLVVYRLFEKAGEIFFHGTVHVIDEIAEKSILRVI